MIDLLIFYITGQGRLDGAFCDYTEKEKLDFLHDIHQKNVINMEMESLAFAALTHHAGIRAAVICVTLLNRLNGDQVLYTTLSHSNVIYKKYVDQSFVIDCICRWLQARKC